jgi:hypothetical protein
MYLTDLPRNRKHPSKFNTVFVYSENSRYFYTPRSGNVKMPFVQILWWEQNQNLNQWKWWFSVWLCASAWIRWDEAIISFSKYLIHSTRICFLKKVTDVQLLKKLLSFYETRKFVTLYTRARHWSLSWITWDQFTPYTLLLKFRQVPILTHVRLSQKESLPLRAFFKK